MRLSIPYNAPRRRIDASISPPLEPSPVERRRESPAVPDKDRQRPAARSRPDRTVRQQRNREARTSGIPHGQLVERRITRHDLPQKTAGLSLHDEEIKALRAIGTFRLVTTRDLADTVYGGRRSQLQRDLKFLEEKGVVEINSVSRRKGRGGKVDRIEVVTLTEPGGELVRQVSGLPEDQKLYSGIVKPREVEHDAQIYRAWLKEASRIEQKGGTNLRVQLDFELKSKVQKAIHAERKADPKRDVTEIREQVAKQLELPFVDRKIRIPDARIDYDLPRSNERNIGQGSRTGHEDIEVLTAKYQPSYLRAKAQAGFRVYASSSARATLTAKIEDDHHLIEDILEL
jgi:hypothetical protein